MSRLVKVAHEEIGNQPDWSADREGYHAYERRRREEMAEVKRHLTEREGARFSRKPGYDVSMTLAGICTSCTDEDWGLLTNWQNAARRKITEAQDNCTGHVASARDAKVCGRCGIHIDELRPDDDDPINLAGSGPVPIVAREG